TSDGESVFDDFDVQNIKGLWHLDEDTYNGTVGEVKDETGGHNGTGTGGVVGSSDAMFGKAAELDGVDDEIGFGSWFRYQSYTLSMWVNPSQTQKGWATILNNENSGTGWVLMKDSNIPNRYQFYEADGTPNMLFDINPNTWSQITITRDSASGKNEVYVNGKIKVSMMGDPYISYNDQQIFKIGDWNSSGREWNGKIDEVQVYDRALSDTEIATHYDNYMEKMGGVFNVRKYEAKEPKVTIEGNSSTKSYAGVYGTKTFNRSLYPSIKADFKTDDLNSKAQVLTEGGSGKEYRNLGLVFDDGSIKVTTQAGSQKVYPQSIALKNAQVDTFYTAEFDFSPKDAKIYVYKKGDPKPSLPAYTYNENGWNPKLAFRNYYGNTTIDNIDVKTKSSSTYYTYDDLNRLTKVGGAEGTKTTYAYDTEGNRTSKTDEAGTTNYEYSDANELTKITEPGSKETTFTYDENGNTKTKTTPDGKAVNYTYNNQNQLVEVEKETPDTDLLPDSWQGGNLEPGDGRSTEFAKEGEYSLKINGNSATTKSVIQTVPVNGNVGDVITVSGWSKNVGTTTAGRCVVALVYFNNTDGSRTYGGYVYFERFSHDWLFRSSNIIAQKDYNSMELKLGIFNQTGAVYYDDFKLTKNGGPEQYIEQPSFEMNQDTIEYTYDGNGNRYSKQQIKPGNSINETLYHNDKDGNIVSETRNLSDGSEETVRYVRDLGGKAISMLQGAKTYYFIYNAHGDVTSLTDENGDTVATYEYDEFGNQTSSTGNVYNPLRYSGANNAYFDEETGLYKMGARYQNPKTGRWISRDDYEGEKESPQSQNRYVYTENNPVNMSDPTGHWGDGYHYSMTYRIGRVYLGRKYARIVAKGNKMMDNLRYNAFNPRYRKYHFDQRRSLKRRYKRCRRTAIYYIKKRKIRRGLIWFGKGLHSLQDYYAHPKGTWKGVTGHAAENSIHFWQKSWYGSWSKVFYKYESIYDSPKRNRRGAQKAKRATRSGFRYFTRKAFGVRSLLMFPRRIRRA
ncbi:hypothetical protein LCGC14_1478970, partial [marine sediment metagenome]